MNCICTEIINGKPDAVVNPDCPLHGSLSRNKPTEEQDEFERVANIIRNRYDDVKVHDVVYQLKIAHTKDIDKAQEKAYKPIYQIDEIDEFEIVLSSWIEKTQETVSTFTLVKELTAAHRAVVQRIEAAVQATLPKPVPADQETPACKWKPLDEDCPGAYETACDEAFQFAAGEERDRKIKFCPFCGGRIITEGGYNDMR